MRKLPAIWLSSAKKGLRGETGGAVLRLRAVVGRHPFGGFKMSGGGTKAGGSDYLLNFLVPRVVTENIMRHGFAPEATPERRAEFLWPLR